VRFSAVVLALGLLIIVPFAASAHAQTTEADVFVSQAILDFDDKRYEAAIQNLRRALELEADHVEALYYMGIVHMTLRRPGDAVPFLIRARAKSPKDSAVAFQLGLAYFAQERYDLAQPLLEEVFRATPTLDGLGYYVGFMRYRNKDYRGALRAFREGRTGDPALRQLTRFYTALALVPLGLSSQAAAEVEQALRLAPGSPLTAPAERLRDTLVATRAQDRRLTAEARVGLFYDDNVAVVPNQAAGDTTVSELRGTRHHSTGEFIGLRVDYSWLRHFVAREDWDSSVGYSFFGTYNNDLPSFNVTNHLLNATVIHRTLVGSMPAQAGLQYSWDVLYLDGEEFLQRNTVTIFGALIETDTHLTQLFARYQARQFNRREAGERVEFRDGVNYMLGGIHLVRFAQDAHFVKLGYQWDRDDTLGRNHEYVGHRLLAGVQYTTPWRAVRLKYDVDVHFRDYAHRHTMLPVANPETVRRHDTEITNTARVEWPFLTTCPLKNQCLGWTLSAEYQRTDAQSNIAAFDYARNVFSLGLTLTY
jgi:tetratricopeptide (TPR) repeat protein